MKVLNGIFHALRSPFLCTLLITALILLPQDIFSNDIFNAGLSFDIVTPQNDFKDNLDRNGYGGSGYALVQPNPLVPVKFGLELGFANYGNESRREPFSHTIPDVTVNVKRNNNMFLGHLLLRGQKEFGNVSPYIDGLFGLTYLWTTTTIEGDENIEPIASSQNIDDIVLSYGFGGGVMLKVWSGTIPEMDTGSVYIDLKVRYLSGGEAEYLKEGAIAMGDNGKVTYDITESRTDMMLYQIGVSVGF
ncbi:hypothetical protein ACFL6P_06410 [Candidatus Latescibacterota bacterium]